MTAMFEGYDADGPAYDEMFEGDELRSPYSTLESALRTLGPGELSGRVDALQTSYLDQGVTFDIGGEERAFPLDILPRVIEMDTWSTIDAGVQQRVRTLEAFLSDVYDRDYFGNEVTAFEVLDPHEQLTVVATSTVHTQRSPAPDPVLTWDDLATPDVADRWTEYLELPALVAPPEDFAEQVAAFRSHDRPGAAARAVCELVNREVTYQSGSTDAATPAVDAWAQRAGVCQDMAHIALGGLRSLGIPARYVSGYLHPKPDAEVGETVPGESHAWVEWWDDGWRAFDPTNDLEPGDRWVDVATGRDYLDVKPLSGIYSGAATSSMFVQVDVTRLV